MPELLQPEAVSFTLTGGVPEITLAVPAPVSPVSPVSPGSPVSPVSPVSSVSPGDWSILVMVTVLVIDGPGDLGYLIPRFGPAAADVPESWESAVTTAGGAHVRFNTGAPFFARHLTA